jgi:hypothetical protein
VAVITTEADREAGEAQNGTAVDRDRIEKHRCRPDPKPSFTIQGAIHDEGFLRFRMPGNPNDFVVMAFVVPIAAGRDHRVFFR